MCWAHCLLEWCWLPIPSVFFIVYLHSPLLSSLIPSSHSLPLKREGSAREHGCSRPTVAQDHGAALRWGLRRQALKPWPYRDRDTHPSYPTHKHWTPDLTETETPTPHTPHSIAGRTRSESFVILSLTQQRERSCRGALMTMRRIASLLLNLMIDSMHPTYPLIDILLFWYSNDLPHYENMYDVT